MKEKQNKRILLSWKGWVLFAVCIALITLCVFVIVKIATSNNKNNSQNGATNNDDLQISHPVLYIEWNGLKVSPELHEWLSNAQDSDSFDIAVSPLHSIPNDYVYNGKVFDEYFLELNKAKTFLSKLEYLVYEGDLLKYGELLYTEGTPDGTKWKKTRYEKIIDYYGEEILNTYIINKAFLKNKLISDIENARKEVEILEIAIEKGKEAFRIDSINEGLEAFQKINQNAFVEEEQIHLTVTKAELFNLKIDNKEKYRFYLASE